jgi:hypothetical protein
MPRKYKVHKIVLDLLKTKELSRIQLLEGVRHESGLSVSDKTLNEALVSLLHDNEIGVVGYDLSIYNGVSRVQSLKSDGILFSMVKKDQIEIGILLTKLDSENLDDARNAFTQLRMIFKNKIAMLINDGSLKQVSPEKISDMFNTIVNYIGAQEANQKRIIMQKFAWALSDEKDSNKTLKQLLAFFRMY